MLAFLWAGGWALLVFSIGSVIPMWRMMFYLPTWDYDFEESFTFWHWVRYVIRWEKCGSSPESTTNNLICSAILTSIPMILGFFVYLKAIRHLDASESADYADGLTGMAKDGR